MAVAFSLAMAANRLHAQTIYWNGTSNDWTNVNDWSTASGATTPAPGAVPGPADTAVFSISTVSAGQTVYLNANQSVLGLQVAASETGGITINSGVGTNTLTIGAGGITGATGTSFVLNSGIVLNGNQTWTTGNPSQINDGITGAGNLTLDGGYTMDAASVATSTWAWTGTLTINGNMDAYANVLNGATGGVIFNTSDNFGVQEASANTFNVTNSIVLNFSKNWYTNGNNQTFSGAVISVNSSSMNTIGSGTVTFSGAADNTNFSFVTTSGAGSMTFLNKTSGSNVHAIGRELSIAANNTVEIAGTGGYQLSGSAIVFFNSTSGTFDFNGDSETFDQLSSGAGTTTSSILVTNNDAGTTSTLTIGAAGGTSTYEGAIQNGASGSGVVAITKSGAGTLSISGANNYTGATYVSGGNLTVANTSSLGSGAGPVVLSGGGSLSFTNIGGTVSLPAATSAWQSSSNWRGVPSNLGNGISYQVGANGGGAAQPDFILVNLGATYSLSQLSVYFNNGYSAMQILTAPSTYTFSQLYNANGNSNSSPSTLNLADFTADSAVIDNTTNGAQESLALNAVAGQYLVLYVTGRTGNSYGIDLNPNLVLTEAGSAITQTIGSLSSSDPTTSVSISALVTLSTGTDNTNTTFAGSITGAGGLTKVGTGKFVLSGSNSYSGTTGINSGILSLASASALGGGGNIDFGGGTLQYSGSNQGDYSSYIVSSARAISIDVNGQSVTFGSALASSNTGGLTLNDSTGGGTLNLTAANSFTGNTTVNAGTLNANASGALGTSNMTVNTGGTLLLNKSSAASGNVNLNGGTLALPTSQVAQSLGSLTLSANSTIDFGVGSAGSTILFSDLGSMNSGTLTINNWSSSDTLAFATTSNTTSNLATFAATEVQFDTDNGNFAGEVIPGSGAFAGDYELVPVPEPSTIAAGLGLLAFVFWKERRRIGVLLARLKKSPAA